MSEAPPEPEASGAWRRPHQELRSYVGVYHGYRQATGAPGTHRGLPSTGLTLVIAFGEPLDIGWLRDDASRCRFWVTAAGLSTEPVEIWHPGRQYGVMVDLTPAGSRALLGLPAAELDGHLVSLHDVDAPFAATLYEAVATAPSWRDRFAALDRHLLARLRGRQDNPGVAAEVHQVWRLLPARVGGCAPRRPRGRSAGAVGT